MSLQYSALVTSMTTNYGLTLRLPGVDVATGANDVVAVRYADTHHAIFLYPLKDVQLPQ